jgi:hypothetical protein
MEKRKRVAVHGNSIPMAGIAASLKEDPGLEVFCISPDAPNTRQRLEEENLSAIVFDLSDPPLQVDITLFHDRPELVLIGIDLSKDELLVLSGQSAKALSMADLVSVIHKNESQRSFIHAKNHSMNHNG